MVKSWVESRRRGREDSLTSLVTTAPLGAALPAVVPANTPQPSPQTSFQTAPKPANSATATNVTVSRTQALVSVIRGVGSPLQSAVSEVASGLRERGQPVSAVEEARAFALLVQQVVLISRTTASTLDIGQVAIARWNNDPLRWSVLEAVSDIVGAQYRAAGLLQPGSLVSQIVASVTQIAVDGAKREDLMPGLGTSTQARLGLDMLRAVPPVVHAVARYAFGRTPLVLVTEIAWELQFKAVEATRRLLTKGSSLDDWHSVYGAFLIAAGQLYAEAHFAESDRIARLSADERQRLTAQHGQELPMTTVWETFDRKLDLLASFSGYMAVPKA